MIAFRDEVRGMGQALGEISVGGENDETFAILVEATGAKKTILGEFPRQHGENRIGIVWVVVGAREAPGLVHR